MRTRVAALAFAGLWTLAACTAPAPGAMTPQAAPVDPPATAASSPGAPTAGTSASATTTPSAATSKPPATIVLSGTAIGDRLLGYAPPSKVDPMVQDKLGKPKLGRPQLCQSGTDRAQLAVIDHLWPGFTVRYGSSGAPAVAVGWSVDLANVPDGFALGGSLPWRPTFAALKRGDVRFSTRDGVQSAYLPRQQLTYSGPVGATRPDTVTGGPLLTCE